MVDGSSFGIYVHWPFCLHKCPYCDFNSHVRKEIDYQLWRKAYLSAIDYWKDYRRGEKLTSIYFGGGTPSTAPPHIIDAIINEISKHWDLSNAEISLEANPTSVEAANFVEYANSGVNRVSIGFQAFNDRDLKLLGRMHTVNESLEALDIANKYFPRTNFDLIYARQWQSLDDWQNELKQLVTLSPSHVSLYQLTIEPNTRFGDMYERGKLLGMPSADSAYDQYVWTRDFMRENGFEHYEISNFAKPDEKSRHNLIYWNYADYLGIGPGAHGRLWRGQNRIATLQPQSPEEWLSKPLIFHEEDLDAQALIAEYLIMGLRLEKGISLERICDYGYELPSAVLDELKALELIEMSNSRIYTTDKGRLVLNRVIEKLLTE